jgi:hypothetical protein
MLPRLNQTIEAERSGIDGKTDYRSSMVDDVGNFIALSHWIGFDRQLLVDFYQGDRFSKIVKIFSSVQATHFINHVV